jgi:hypothetical protein
MDLNRFQSFVEGKDLNADECARNIQEVFSSLSNPRAFDGLKVSDIVGLYNKSRMLQENYKDYGLQLRAACSYLFQRIENKNVSTSIQALRCFIRTGHSLRMAPPQSTYVIASPKQCYDEAIMIYKSIGLHNMSKALTQLEIQEMCEELWDLLKLHLGYVKNEPSGLDETLEDLHELRMLVPYLPQNGINLVKLVMQIAENSRKLENRDVEATLLSMALELTETMETKSKKKYKRTILVQLVDVYLDLEWHEKAEACWRLLMSPETQQGLLCGVKLFTKLRAFQKASSFVEKLHVSKRI